MQIPVQQFPVLTPGQMNPYHQALQSGLETFGNITQAAYAPKKLQADIASKLAYANLMGPQFLAKLMGNENILPNIPDAQKQSILGLLINAGTTAKVTPPANPTSTENNNQNGLLQSLEKTYHDFIKNNSNQPQNNNANSEYSYDQNGNNIIASPDEVNQAGNQSNLQSENGQVKQAVSAWMQSPEAEAQAQKDGMMKVPAVEELMNWYKNQPQQGVAPLTQSTPTVTTPQQPKTYAENVGEYKGIVEEGQEAGKIRANDIKDLNDVAFNANTMQGTLDQLSKIVNSPEFRQIRQIPLAGQHEIGWYAKFGTPAQKRMVGNLLSEQGQVVVNAAGQFKGAFRVGEQSLINTIKVNPGDMPDVASGKLQAMSLMNQMISQRSALTAKIMEEKHVSKGKAMEMADKLVDGQKIREKIDNSILISVKNKKTGEKKTMSLSEARKLGVPNV